jgi:Spy/CpxP family protein refolding chaperone
MISVALAVGGVVVPAHAQRAAIDAEETVGFLQEELGLTDDQAQQVGGAVGEFVQSVQAAQEKKEADDESDGMAMMADIKAARGVYQKEMEGILTPEQWEQYQALVDETMNEIYQEIAHLKIQDLEQPLQLSDAQVEQLKPIIGTGMRQMIGTVFEFSDKRMSVPNKLKLANALKKAKKQMDAGMEQVLTPEQWAQVEAMREEKKG